MRLVYVGVYLFLAGTFLRFMPVEGGMLPWSLTSFALFSVAYWWFAITRYHNWPAVVDSVEMAELDTLEDEFRKLELKNNADFVMLGRVVLLSGERVVHQWPAQEFVVWINGGELKYDPVPAPPLEFDPPAEVRITKMEVRFGDWLGTGRTCWMPMPAPELPVTAYPGVGVTVRLPPPHKSP